MSISDTLRSDPAQASLALAPLSYGSGINDNVFFAIQPPATTAPSITRLRQDVCKKHEVTGKLVPPRCFHFSLLFVGFYGRLSPATLAAFVKAASTVAMPPFRIALDRVSSFGHSDSEQRPLVLRGDDGLDGLKWLRDRLVAATLDIPGFSPSRSFNPHLTLLRGKHKIDEPIEPISWTASEFVLIRSIHSETRHVVLGRWKLRG
jgi:2'-5' RNA ligase